MYLIIISVLLASSFADLRSYVPPHFGGSTRSHLNGGSGLRFVGSAHQPNGLAGHAFAGSPRGGFVAQQPGHDRFIGGGLQHGFRGGHSSFDDSGEHISCGDGQVLSFDGHCVEAEVSKSIYLYSTPARRSRPRSRPAFIPKPKLNYNVVFVRAPEDEVEEPVIVPPPQQKTIVYVLSKDSDSGEQQVIELPGGPSLKPEVYYVNYRDGENPELSLGLNLEGALSSAVREEAQTILTHDDAAGHFGSSGESRFGGHSGISGGHSGFEGTQEFHVEGPELSSDEDDVQRHHLPLGHPHPQPQPTYGLPSHK